MEPHENLSSNEIECAYCGEEFFYELTHCPNCGRSVYPDEIGRDVGDEIWGLDIDDPGEVKRFGELTRQIMAVAAGLLVAFAVGSLMFFGMGQLVSNSSAPLGERILPMAGVPAGALLGGYLAGALTSKRIRLMGISVGGLSIFIVYVLAGYESNLAESKFWTLENLGWSLGSLVAGYWGSEIYRRQQRNTVIEQLFGDVKTEEELYNDLYIKAGYDADRVERLVQHEKGFMPNANRRTLIESAIQRWERDNR